VGTYLDIMPPIIQHFIEQVYEVTPLGEGTEAWRYFDHETSQHLDEIGGDERLFEVFVSREESITNPNAWGSTETDYDVPVNIDICYHEKDDHTVYGLNDFEKIKRQIMNSDTSGLTGFNFARFEEYLWAPGIEEDSKYRFMRIPVIHHTGQQGRILQAVGIWHGKQRHLQGRKGRGRADHASPCWDR
jgi:hypothetical protein